MSQRDQLRGILAFVPWALANPGRTVQEAARRFGVRPRVIRRWVYHLDFCGRPPLGGGDLFEADIDDEDRIWIRMADELARPLTLSPLEALLLVAAARTAQAVLGPERAAALESAVRKIGAAVAVPEVSVLEEPMDAPWMAELRDAIEQDRQVELRYRRRADDELTQRTVDPWLLREEQGVWYLDGFDHLRGELRTFRLDRIEDLSVVARPRRRRPPARGVATAGYQPSEDDLEVELELGPEVRWVADAVVPTAVEERDGTLRVVLHTPATAWLVRLLLSAGAEARVRRPRWLAEQLREEASRAAQRYAAG